MSRSTEHNLPNGVGWWKDGKLFDSQPPGISYEVCLTMDADRAVRAAVAAETKAQAVEIERLRAAIEWALGTRGDFEPPPSIGPYWWRSELAERAGIFWNGERWVAPAAAAEGEKTVDTRKLCTCDGAGRGPGRACVVKAGGRLGELWRCAEGKS